MYLNEGNFLAAKTQFRKSLAFFWGTETDELLLKLAKKLETHKALQFLGDVYLEYGDQQTAMSLFVVALEGFTQWMFTENQLVDIDERLAGISSELLDRLHEDFFRGAPNNVPVNITILHKIPTGRHDTDAEGQTLDGALYLHRRTYGERDYCTVERCKLLSCSIPVRRILVAWAAVWVWGLRFSQRIRIIECRGATLLEIEALLARIVELELEGGIENDKALSSVVETSALIESLGL
ncbi:hypothetical protein FB451DRAFT_1183084 [Mycena latifolia]|nr:hypothetical protein FB451DRAFT_1183084 [Mycena latifolia]